MWTLNDSSGGAAGFTMKNITVDQLLGLVMNYIGKGQPPFFNKTNILAHIDIEMNADMTIWQTVIKELQKNGLDLVKGTKQMKVVVVKD